MVQWKSEYETISDGKCIRKRFNFEFFFLPNLFNYGNKFLYIYVNRKSLSHLNLTKELEADWIEKGLVFNYKNNKSLRIYFLRIPKAWKQNSFFQILNVNELYLFPLNKEFIPADKNVTVSTIIPSHFCWEEWSFSGSKMRSLFGMRASVWPVNSESINHILNSPPSIIRI